MGGGEYRGQRIEQRRPATPSQRTLCFCGQPFVGQHDFCDPRSRIELWDAIRALVVQGTDVLLTTQYLDEADQLAHQIVIIDHGKVIATGTPRELKAQAGRDVVEVHVRTHDEVAPAAHALSRLGQGEPHTDPATLLVSITVDAGPERLMEAVRALTEQ